jgi:hypothetical protein
MGIDELTKAITGEWVVIAHAPVTFFASLLVIAFALWKIIQWQYGAQLTNAQSALTLRDAQLQDYKDKLSGATPDEAKARMDALENRIDEILPQLAALSPRKVSKEQTQIMVRFLDKFPECWVEVASDAGSADADQMSKGLVAAFAGARWRVQTPMVMGVGNAPPSGVGLRVPDPVNLSPQQQAVADALTAADIAFDLQIGRVPSDWPGAPSPVAQIILTTRLRN